MPPLSRSQRSSSSSCSIYNPSRFIILKKDMSLEHQHGASTATTKGIHQTPRKTYIHIFTSLISAKDVKAQNGDATGEEDMEGITPPATYQRTLKTGCAQKHICKDIASTLNMGNKVTSCSIVYTAVQQYATIDYHSSRSQLLPMLLLHFRLL
ncbi:hypothetical protein BDQ12DRAFT_712775 [Crucibulum laeve]|uniref:Uncharacterized protein n=1 Tax=Crucibulum laeve TaxID=68775 RepID=A0A5C3LZ07_9AGAR|nr:hypothetical protein BDQ12DRAFT_712775 [Crucibulum laeve]